MITDYTAKGDPTYFPRYPNHDSSGSNAIMVYTCDRSGSDPMITEYTAKDASAVVTLDVNSDNSLSQGNFQSTNINDDATV